MDVDVCAGGDSTRRKGDPAGEGGAMEIVPLEMYDSARAKIDANLRWLFAKAYGIDHVPQDLRDPFYTDQYDQEHIKPPVIRLLLSGELYCRVCGLVLKGEQAATLHTHQSVIQALARKGIYVLESDNTPVSNADLSSAPIKMSAHIPLIDALMMAYTVEMISIERVVTSVKRFSTFSASKELPFDLEDAMVFWINKVNMKMREITDKETKMKQHLLESPSHQKPDLMHALAHCLLEPVEYSRVVRYRRDHLTGRTLQHFPLLDDLMKDVCDGAALLAVVHFYCPELMRLEDICLKEVPSIADSLYNIQLLREFSNEYLNRANYLRPEDLLYAPPVLKGNVMVFIAELFWWFETVKPDFVQPRDLQEIKDVRSLLQPKSSRPHIPISNATRRSFLLTPDSPILIPASSSSPDICNSNIKASPSTSPCHSLLPLRQRQQQMQEDELLGQRTRSNSLTRVDGKTSTQVQGSVLAWPERRQRPLSQPVPYALHFSVESDGDTVSLARSISKDSLVSNILSMTPKHSLGGPHLPPAPSRLNSQGFLIGNVRIEDEEVDVEEEELVAIIHPDDLVRRCAPDTEMEPDDLEVQTVTSRGISKAHSPRLSPNPGQPPVLSPDPQTDSFYLEPLMPAVLKPAKEKSVNLNKEEESGESRSRVAGFRRTTEISVTSRRSLALEPNLNHTFAPIPGAMPGCTPGFAPLRPPTEGAVGPSMGSAAEVAMGRERSSGFFLHLSEPGDEREQGGLASLPGQVQPSRSPYPAWEVSRDSDSELEDEEEDEEQMELAREVLRSMRGKCLGEGGGEDEKEEAGEGESAKLREDMKVCERDDKEGGSGRSSPCLSTASWASSASGSASIRMTSFAERKLQKVSFPDGCSSTTSSQKTTPDGSESAPYPLGGSWHLGRLGKEGLASGVGVGTVASELVQLHMQLEEQRRAIEHQKKKMETLSARQRLKLGKAAFLNIVKKGKSDTLPQPLKHPQDPQEQGKTQASRDDSCLGALRSQGHGKVQGPEGQQNRDNRTSIGDLEDEIQGPEPDLGDCSRSIEMLNEAISSIQQQMMQMSLQQDLLMKQSLQSPPEATTGGAPPGGPPAPTTPSACNPPPDSRVCPAVHFVEIAASNPLPTRRPPKLSSVRGARTKPSTLKLSKENGRAGSKLSTLSTDPEAQAPRWGERRGESFVMCQESPGEEGRVRKGESFVMYAEPPRSLERGKLRNTTFRVQAEDKEPSSREGLCQTPNFPNADLSSTGGSTSHSPCLGEGLERRGSRDSGGLQEEHAEEMEGFKGKGHLIEVDLSEVKDPSEGGGSDTPDMSADGETKSGLGFFFKDDEKAEDEMAKRRAAFLLKQQRKAEETRLRKLQLEADSELKRDEARRKAEEDRVRKEEEKARRELIKQEYLRRKQQELLEEQGLVKPRPRAKPRNSRPKSLHRGESCSEAFSKGSTTPTNLSCGLGSTLSLATETESVTSGGAGSQRAGSVGSVDSFPILSRNSSRNMERDWENGSTASSITSTAEYNGPKLFKEPSSKSNKPLITNAIAHCCLAGKVNEGQKNVILEELEKCESNHLMILFRDGGCQFRAIYSFSPETEEIAKFTGTGPRTISRKMIDKLYKYSSDRKQFTVIPAKTVSVSVDALTIHNHLWQVKRSGGSRKK